MDCEQTKARVVSGWGEEKNHLVSEEQQRIQWTKDRGRIHGPSFICYFLLANCTQSVCMAQRAVRRRLTFGSHVTQLRWIIVAESRDPMNNEVLSSHKSLTQELHFARRISGFCTRYLARGRFSLSHVRTLSECKWQRQIQCAFITHGRVTKPNELRTVRISYNYSVFYVILYSALLGYYIAGSGNSLPTFRDNPSVPSWGPKCCPETSVRNYHYSLRNNPEERSFHLLRGGKIEITQYRCATRVC